SRGAPPPTRAPGGAGPPGGAPGGGGYGGAQPAEPLIGRSPAASAGNRPARSSDDLPTPDGPITTSGPPPRRICTASRDSNLAISRSRPRKNRACSGPNDTIPGYGQATSSSEYGPRRSATARSGSASARSAASRDTSPDASRCRNRRN